MSKLVRDLMHPGVFTCQPDASLGQVAVLLTQHKVHALIVIDREDRPIGIISDYDLLAGEWLSVDDESLSTMRKLTAQDLMSYPVDTIEADMPIKEAAHISHRKRCQPLTGDRRQQAGWCHLHHRFCSQHCKGRKTKTRNSRGCHVRCHVGLSRENADHLGCANDNGSRLEVRAW